MISGTRHALVIENEEMVDPLVSAAVLGAARRHVAVTVVMTANPRWDATPWASSAR